MTLIPIEVRAGRWQIECLHYVVSFIKGSPRVVKLGAQKLHRHCLIISDHGFHDHARNMRNMAKNTYAKPYIDEMVILMSILIPDEGPSLTRIEPQSYCGKAVSAKRLRARAKSQCSVCSQLHYRALPS